MLFCFCKHSKWCNLESAIEFKIRVGSKFQAKIDAKYPLENVYNDLEERANDLSGRPVWDPELARYYKIDIRKYLQRLEGNLKIYDAMKVF